MSLYWIFLIWPIIGMVSGFIVYCTCGAYSRGEDMTLKELMLVAVMGPVLPVVAGVLTFIDRFHPSRIIVFHGKRK